MAGLKMKNTPMLYKAEMVRALLDGSKTQTRRLVKHARLNDDITKIVEAEPNTNTFFAYIKDKYGQEFELSCPYGQVGDRIWVKETWRTWEALDKTKPSNLEDGALIEYAAGGNSINADVVHFMSKKWRSPLFMQERFSRITLEITGVRVERLNDISPSDAIAEGIKVGDFADIQHDVTNGISLVDRYRNLWQSINGAGSWYANPYVWVIEFKVVTK